MVSLIADERAGLVAELAATVAEHGGNWLESQMGQLAGKFAGAVLIEVDAAQVEALSTALRGLSSVGIVDVSETSEAPSPVATEPVGLHVVGHDQPGIVREVTQALAERGLSIQEFHTSTSDAPMSGDRLFEALAVVALPDGTDRAGLHSALEEISRELSVDIQLDDGEGSAWGQVPEQG